MKNILCLKTLYFLLATSFIFISCTEKDPFQACRDFEKKDQEMLDLEEKIKVKYRADKVFIDLFEDTQVHWIQYRIRRVRALYPRDWDKVYREKYGREVFNPCKCEENLRLTSLRVEELKAYLDNRAGDYSECPTVFNELEKKED